MTTAIILLGHGSRAPGASDTMERVAATFAKRHPGQPVHVAHMELCQPDVPTTIAACVAAGAREILVVPYFLHLGAHLREDIPALLRTAVAAHPGVVIRCGPPFGYDDLLVELVAKRVADTRTAPPVA
jgi:sirohydrochlorin cobaltochelatase